MVYGTAALEEPDNEKEIFDYETSKPHWEAVAAKMSKASGGKNLMPVRAMHHDGAPISAGHATELSFDDDGKKIKIAAKITDDNEWRKCLLGTYTGFSMEGKYLRRWADKKRPDHKRYTGYPLAVVLADRPMMDGATFDLVKADGVSESIKMKTGSSAEVVEYRDMVDQFWSCKTVGHEHSEKDDAIDCVKKSLTGDVEVPEAVEADPEPDESAEPIINKAAGDGEQVQEDEMDEKDLAKLQAMIAGGSEDIKKAFTTQSEDVKKTFTAAVDDVKKTMKEDKEASDKLMDDVEEAVGDIAKALVEFMSEPADDDDKPIVKAVSRSKDVGADDSSESDDEDSDEEEEEKVVKAARSRKVKGFRSSLNKALANPVVFGR